MADRTRGNGVYRIRNITNGKCYVGSAAGYKGLRGRWNEHRRDVNNQKHHSIVFQRAWDKYGEENFAFEILEECESRECIECEQYWMDLLEPEYNIAKKAGSSLGLRWKLSEKTKARMSKANLGRKHSEASKIKMSVNSKGKTAGIKNGRCKLTVKDIINIRNLYTGKHGELSQLARQYDVVVSTISKIVKKELWGNI